MKRLILLVTLFLLSFPALAQFTTTTGTIVDGDGTTWFNAKVTVQFVPNPNYPQQNQYNVNGVPLTSNTYAAYLNQTVTANASGAFSLQLIDNTQIAPSGSSWKFVIQSYTSAPSSEFPNLAVSGASQSVSAFILTNITAPRFSAISSQFGSSYGYGTVEVATTPIPGGSFFNVTTGSINVWACTATGCSWQTQAVGSFCSASGCTFTGPLLAPQLNNICEASQQAGSDFVAQIIACQNASYMSSGGIITAYGYGASTQTATTVLPSLGNTNTQNIALMLSNATTFIWNQSLGTAAGPGNCIVPVANGSSITSVGFVPFARTNWKLGASATAYDFVCNQNWYGAQEAMAIHGLALQGNASATLAGSLLHLRAIYVPTNIENVSTYTPYGNAVTVELCSDINFDHDTFSDGAPSGAYVGTVLTIVASTNITFKGGAVQDNGIYNPLMIILGYNATSGFAGGNSFGIHFYNTDFETQAATIGSFGGHATNVDPIQITDCSGCLLDGLLLPGVKGTGQLHVVDIMSSGENGQTNGPVEIKNITTGYSSWGAVSLIHNTAWTYDPNYVYPPMRDVFGQLNGAEISIGSYRWLGSARPTGFDYDYLENQKIYNLQATNFSVTTSVFSGLPGCSSGLEGSIAAVTDSTTATFGQVITGGGISHVQAYCNGTAWTVTGGAPPAGNTSLSQVFTICPSGCTYTATICTTTGLAFSSGACSVGTYAWPRAFADSNYAASCSAPGGAAYGTGGSGAIGIILTWGNSPLPKSTSGLSIGLQATTATATTTAEIDCLGVHN